MKHKIRFFLPIILTSVGMILLGSSQLENDKTLSWMPRPFPQHNSSRAFVDTWFTQCLRAADERYTLGSEPLSNEQELILKRNKEGVPAQLLELEIIEYRKTQCRNIFKEWINRPLYRNPRAN